MHQARSIQLEARERLVVDLEEASRTTQARAEEECRRLQGVLNAIEAGHQAQRSQTEEERVRLREEHARLEAMQMTLQYVASFYLCRCRLRCATLRLINSLSGPRRR